MSTTFFYAPPEACRGDWLELPEEEAHHAVRVLRKEAGDRIEVVDGAGGWYLVELAEVAGRRAAGQVVARSREVGEPDYALTVALAPLKNRGRFEIFLEKAVELGVREVVPLLTARTERERVKETRAQKILLAAMKQSRRSRLPVLTEPQGLDEMLAARFELGLLCHEAEGPEHTILAALARTPAAVRLGVLVGPEGGFTEEEVAAARQAGFAVVSLGPRRLRAETAALAAAAAVMLTRSGDSP